MKKITPWPWAIVAALTLFMVMTVAFVRVAFSERVDLVAKDYYYRDKEYSRRIEKEKRLLQLGTTEIKRSATGIDIALPTFFAGKKITGKAYFYSPLNPAEDFEIPLAFSGTRTTISAPLKSGQKWRVTLDFISGDYDYFVEQVLW